MSVGTHYCEKCNRTMSEKEFYRSKNLEKYPQDGLMNQCKKCMTMFIDNWDPNTFLWILQEADIPYVPEEWQKTMENFVKDGKSPSGSAVMGRYLSRMKLKKWKDYRWKDNDFLRDLRNEQIKANMKDQGYDENEIALAVAQSSYEVPAEAPVPYASMPTRTQLPPTPIGLPAGGLAPNIPRPEPTYEDDDFGMSMPLDIPEIDLGLTEEDITYLRLKWGKTYKQEEWVALEQLYKEMMDSYDIQSAGDINTLKLACKSSLKANQLLDLGDVDGAQKVTKMYDSLMKSGKWTAAQNKAETDEVVDSIGELVALCERDGFIPKYYTDGPQDHVDRVLEDMQRYTRTLIENESGISQMIENALKQMEEEDERIKEASEADDNEEDALFNYDTPVLETEDFEAFEDFEDNLEEMDEDLFNALIGEDDE